MRAGSLNRYIDIQQGVVVNGIQKWQTITNGHVPASIESQSGGESARADLAPLNVFQSLITIRYRSDVAPKMRVVFSGRIFEIVSVNDPDTGYRELLLVVKETQT